MGYLYYGHYAQLYEIGRAETIRELGITYREMEEDHGFMMPVVSLECRYHYPATYDDLLTIETELREMPTKMITFHHVIKNADLQVLNKGVVKLFFIETETQRRVSCPAYLEEKLGPYFE